MTVPYLRYYVVVVNGRMRGLEPEISDKRSFPLVLRILFLSAMITTRSPLGSIWTFEKNTVFRSFIPYSPVNFIYRLSGIFLKVTGLDPVKLVRLFITNII